MKTYIYKHKKVKDAKWAGPVWLSGTGFLDTRLQDGSAR
jgi:hypothetical protein